MVEKEQLPHAKATEASEILLRNSIGRHQIGERLIQALSTGIAI